MLTKTWNTGRLYAKEGQIITATHHDDGVVTFMDHSRNIDGELRTQFPAPMALTAERLRTVVMDAYDHNNYDASRRAWQDGMALDGCNAKR